MGEEALAIAKVATGQGEEVLDDVNDNKAIFVVAAVLPVVDAADLKKVKRISSKTLRKKWEEATGKKWPK